MRTALTVITTAILTAIAFLRAWQNGRLGNIGGTPAIVCPETPTNDKECITLDEGKSCTTPRADDVAHGTAVLSFAAETVSGDILCESTTSICNDGTWLDNNPPQPYQTCTIEVDTAVAQPCVVGDILVPHDSTNTFYRETREGTTYTYQSQQRYCFDGDMDGNDSYNKLNLISTCTLNVEQEVEEEVIVEEAPTKQPVTIPAITQPNEPRYARCAAPFGGIWEHGKGGSVYTQSSVSYGQTCPTTNVVCGYGTLRYGTPDNIGEPVTQDIFASCTVGEPVGCSTACGDIDHGASVTTYTDGSISYGSDTTCNDVQVRSTCNNGSLSPAGGNACSCKVEPPAACTAPNGQVVAHESSLTLYQYPEVQAVAGDGSDTCIRQWRQCLNGTFHDYNGTPASFTFEHPTCTVLPPPAGGGEGGEGIPQS